MASNPMISHRVLPTSAGHYMPRRNAAGRWEKAHTESIVALLLMAMGLTVAAFAPKCGEWEVDRLGGIAVGSHCVYEQREELRFQRWETPESTPPPAI